MPNSARRISTITICRSNPERTRQQAAVSLSVLHIKIKWATAATPRPVVQAAPAVRRDGRSHKLNVRLRAHWGCHDLKLLNPLEVLLQPRTAADGLATEPKRNYRRMNLQG